MKRKWTKRLLLMFLLLVGVGRNEIEVNAYTTTYVQGFWRYVLHNDGAYITGYTGAESNWNIPSTLGGKSVVELDYEAFKGNKYVVSVTVPASVKTIDRRCFENCEKLTTVSGMQGVTSIGYEAFDNCELLTSVALPSVKSIGEYAFKSTDLTSVAFPASLETIGEYAFKNTNLASVSFPSGLKSVGSGAFYNTALTSVVVPDVEWKYDWYTNGVFEGCKQLEKVTIEQNVEIADYMFTNCEKLKSVELKQGTANVDIGRGAFKGCTSLESVSVPSNVRYIDAYAFNGCTSLKTVNLSYGLIGIGYNGSYSRDDSFDGCSALENISLPASVSYALLGELGALKSITLPNKLSELAVSWNNTIEVKCYAGSFGEKLADSKDTITKTLLQSTPATGITFTSPTVYIETDEVFQLPYTITPAASTDAIYWSSSSSDIAWVNGIGQVYGEKAGTVTIIAQTTSGVQGTINVVVSNKPTSISFANSSQTVYAGKSITQKAVVKDKNGVRNDVLPTYKSSDPSIASVDNTGKVVGVKTGKVTITATTGTLSASYEVTVVVKKPTSITFGTSSKTVLVGKEFTQKAVVRDMDGVRNDLTPSYKSSNPSVASVDSNGKVKAKKSGTTVITATIDNLTASYTVTVQQAIKTLKVTKSGKKLKVKTVAGAKVKVSAKKSVLGKKSKSVMANKRGVATITFKNKIKGVKVKITVTKSGYQAKSITKKY